MTTRSGALESATVADLYRVDGKAELIDGEIVHMPPTGWMPSQATSEIFVSLRRHARRTGTGVAVGDNAGFVVSLPGRRSFSPDAAFWTGPLPGMRFFDGAPVFAVEVRSEGDYGSSAERAIVTKRADYFLAGTRAVWDVDLLAEKTIVTAWFADAPDSPERFGRGESAHAGEALPGWSMPVDELLG